MATDNSPTRNRLIVIIAVVTVVTLGLLKFVFDDYFAFMMEGEAKAKLAAPTEIETMRAEEQQRLASGPLPIDQAIHELGSKGRESAALITPQPSNDDGPLVGWSRGERAARAAEKAKEAPMGEATDSDAGATETAAAADAGATPTAPAPVAPAPTPMRTADAGAPHAVPHTAPAADAGH